MHGPLLTEEQAAALYLAACTVYLVSSIWRVAIWGNWGLSRCSNPPNNINLADAVLSTWLVFAVFVILYCIGAMKQWGIWTVQQPWQFAVTPQPVMVPGYAVQTPYGFTQVAAYQQPSMVYPQGQPVAVHPASAHPPLATPPEGAPPPIKTKNMHA